MLVEDRVKVVLVSVEGVFESGCKSDIAAVASPSVVVTFPELERSHVPHDEQSASLERGGGG